MQILKRQLEFQCGIMNTGVKSSVDTLVNMPNIYNKLLLPSFVYW